MGANNVLPSVPTFSAGAPSLSQLQALSYAVGFLVDQDVRPTFHLFKTTTQSISANTWTTVTFDHTAYDCDGVQAYPGVTIVTQGRYCLEALVQPEAGSSKDSIIGAFLFTAGANNPNFTNGTQVYFGFKGTSSSTTGAASADNAMVLSDLAPMTFYPADVIDVQVYFTVAHTLDFNQNTSFSQGRFVCNFTGYLVRTGT